MPECKYHLICGLSDEADPEAGLCILHSENPEKDKEEFDKALAAHRENESNFVSMVFPGPVNFRTAGFNGVANFLGTSFLDVADFGAAMFTKDAVFREARFTKLPDFRRATFTKEADFGVATFSERADFRMATFSGGADFRSVKFSEWAFFGGGTFLGEAGFGWTTFSEGANFARAKFSERADFDGARFSRGAFFRGATFIKEADFSVANFSEWADFREATFSEGADFSRSSFSGRAYFQETRFAGQVTFNSSHFQDRTLFSGRQEEEQAVPIFSEAQGIDFSNMEVADLVFRNADLQACRFLGTDLRKIQMVDVIWAKIGRRFVIYDEKLLRAEVKHAERPLFLCGWLDVLRRRRGKDAPWGTVEQLYRQLKQNYEDQRDHERASDFHYGEKEMRRLNPNTRRSLRFFLTLYWLVSGYGERFLRPLMWATGLLVVSTLAYLWWGLSPKGSISSHLPTEFVLQGNTLQLTWHEWPQALHYSFRAMTFLRPDDFVPKGFAKSVYTIQNLLGPLLLGLFALAIRQRLKR